MVTGSRAVALALDDAGIRPAGAATLLRLKSTTLESRIKKLGLRHSLLTAAPLRPVGAAPIFRAVPVG